MTVLVGRTTAGTTADFNASGHAAVWTFVAVASGQCQYLFAQTKASSNSGATAVNLGIYADSAGEPGARLGFAAVDSLAAAQGTGVFRATLASPVTIVSGTTYWLGWHATDPGDSQWNFQGDASANTYREQNSAGAFADPWATATDANGNNTAIVWGEDAGTLPGPSPARPLLMKMRPISWRRPVFPFPLYSSNPVAGTDWLQPIDDVLSLADALAFDRGLTIAETVALVDALIFDRGLVIADTLSLSDAIQFDRAITLADTLSLADNIVASLGLNITINDTLSLADNLATQSGKEVTINDTLSLADALTFARELVLADSVTMSDALAFQREIHIAEALALADAIAFQFDLHIADVLSLADFIDPQLGAPTNWTVDVNDTLSLSDALSFIREILIADSVSIQDSNARQKNGLFLPDGSVVVATSRGPIIIGRF